MKLCHLADSHLGAGENHPVRGKTGLTIRQEDIVGCFIEAIDKIIAIKPDVCIHAGDIFHAVRPLNSILAIAARQLHRLAVENKIPTVIITGNHDAPRQPHVGAALEIFDKFDNLYIAARGKKEQFRIGDGCFTAVPHCLTTSALSDQLQECRPDTDARFNILIMHGVAAGMPEFSMADLGEQELPLDLMAKYDYTALGHFHNYCKVGPNAWYAGSTERLSQSERDSTKGFIEVDFEPFNVRFHEVAARPMVDVKTINATGKRGDQLLKIIEDNLAKIDSSDKIVRVNIEGVSAETLKTLPSEALAELKRKSFALDVRFKKEKEPEEDAIFDLNAAGQFDQKFAQFLQTSDLQGFDSERLIREALKYLHAEQ